ncbi:MAG: hypothetical protein WBO46_14595, partial [Caldilineaceae bacterium]
MTFRFSPSSLSDRWLVFVFVLTAALMLAGCSVDEFLADEDTPVGAEQDAGDDYYYTETPEDCLEDEEFDEVDELCYPIVYCDEEGVCEEEEYGFLDLFFDLVDELVWGVAGGNFEDSGEAEENTLVTYRVDGNQIV